MSVFGKELIYSEQSLAIIESCDRFSKEDFEKWYAENLTVGSNNILMYLMDKRKKLKSKIIIPIK